EDLLDLVDQRLAPLHVDLARLPLEEILDLRNDTSGVRTFLADIRLEPRRGVTAGAGDADDQVLELLLTPRGGEGGALHRPVAGLDPEGLQMGGERLPLRRVRGPGVEVASVEAVGIPRLDHELLGLRRIEGRRLEHLRELEGPRNDATGRPREPER